ncbi:putative glutathione-S-transferase theta, GST [Stachybotrys elegans]|uniref:Glutathione-S-transferase theta, GST n=1 Tax=Stachybotrys elegans TaxID=80388 RepID=A0A8K0T2K7_9HYPO|nr:putative glutathione-S-transferase theta, GST [Stachybotrys elegans]
MASQDTSLPPETTGAAAKTAERYEGGHVLKLYGSWFCPFVQRSWITLLEKKIPHQYIEMNPYKKDPAFIKMNPRGLVPTLAVPVGAHGTEQKPLFESLVICEYLDEAYSDEDKYGKRLLPDDAYERARARLWIDHISTRIVPGFYKLLQHTPDKKYSIQQARDELHGHIRSLVEQMDADGPWFLGQHISLVDICLIPWAKRLWLIDHYKDGGVGIPAHDEKWKRWQTWMDAVDQHPSVKDTMSSDERYILAYKRYADDTTESLVGRATRQGEKLP